MPEFIPWQHLHSTRKNSVSYTNNSTYRKQLTTITADNYWSSSSSPYQCQLKFLPANVSKCYGCSQSFAEKIQASSIQHSYEAQRSTYLRCGHYVLKNNYFAEQLLIAITLLGLSSLCTYIALLGQKLLWVESLTIFVNFELIRESLWRWKFSLGWFTKVYLYEFLYEVKNFLNEAKKS